VTFPAVPLDARIEMQLPGWTDVSSYALQRDGGTAPIVITRGRPDETTQNNPAQETVQIRNADGRFTPRNALGPYFGIIGKNTPTRTSVPGTGVALRIEDDSQSWSSTPAPAMLFNLSQDIRIDLALSGWAPCTLMSWWGSGLERAWLLSLNGDGTVTFSWSNDGSLSTLQQATSTLPLPLGGALVLRVTWNHSTGQATYYTAPTGQIAGSSWTQLGNVTPVNANATFGTSTAVLSVGYNSTASADLGLAGLTGRVNDAAVLTGIGGSVLAQPAFSSQAAGATSWADGEGNTWTTGGTATLDNRSYRFHGELSALPQSWDPTGSDVWVALTASGVSRRLAQGNAPLLSPMRRWEQVNASLLLACWPCEDAASATQVASGIGGGFAMPVSGAAGFAADSGFSCSAPIAQVQESTWYGTVGAYSDTGTTQIRLISFLPGSSTSFGGIVAQFRLSGTARLLSLWWSPTTGALQVNGWTSTLATPWTLGSLGVTLPSSGGRYLISIELTSSGGNVTPELRVMDLTGTVTSDSATAYSGTTGTVTQVVVNPADPDPDGASGIGYGGISGAGPLPTCSVGHITVQDTLTAITEMSGPFLAWAGETAGNRFARLCTEEGIQSRITGYPDASAAMGIQSQDTLPDLLQECETADMGFMSDSRHCLGLEYRTRRSVYNQSPAVTLNYAASALGQAGRSGELQPTDDDQQIRNDIILQRGAASGAQGATYQQALDDGSPMSISPPPDGVGDYQTQVTVNLQTDGMLYDATGWALRIGTVDEQRIPELPLNLARTELASLSSQILGAEIGSAVELTSTPAWLPAGPVSQIVLGVSESLGGYWYLISWQTVPSSPYTVAVAASARCDTEGSELTNPVGSSDTTFEVSTTATSGICWTASSALWTAAGTYALTGPPGVTAVAAGGWAGGCGGGGSNTSTSKGGGGGGGEYAAEPALAVTPGKSYAVTVGAAGASSGTGTGGTGGNTTIAGDSVTVTAHAGTGGGAAGSAGSGGTGSTNTTHFSGGAGGSSPSSGDGGGSGGGSGGTASAGNAGTSATSAAATAGAVAVTGGGPGGNGGAHSLPGSAPASGPGGGGGGAGGNDGGASGPGDPGQALITWANSSFPFSVLVDGEEIQVNGIQGQASPQLFQVTRSINGVVKSHSAGAAVTLYPPPAAAW
jgi:hypothetical protein